MKQMQFHTREDGSSVLFFYENPRTFCEDNGNNAFSFALFFAGETCWFRYTLLTGFGESSKFPAELFFSHDSAYEQNIVSGGVFSGFYVGDKLFRAERGEMPVFTCFFLGKRVQ